MKCEHLFVFLFVSSVFFSIFFLYIHFCRILVSRFLCAFFFLFLFCSCLLYSCFICSSDKLSTSLLNRFSSSIISLEMWIMWVCVCVCASFVDGIIHGLPCCRVNKHLLKVYWFIVRIVSSISRWYSINCTLSFQLIPLESIYNCTSDCNESLMDSQFVEFL